MVQQSRIQGQCVEMVRQYTGEFPGFQGKIGFISAISHKFCKDCNRIRMTAEGFVKPCLQFAQGVDMRSLLRGQTDDKELKQVFERLIYESHAAISLKQKKRTKVSNSVRCQKSEDRLKWEL